MKLFLHKIKVAMAKGEHNWLTNAMIDVLSNFISFLIWHFGLQSFVCF
jgi:hypothetical protein